MTKQNIYPILSFENNVIKVAILNKFNNKVNCVYYDECKIDYEVDFRKVEKIKRDEIISSLRALLKHVNDYIEYDIDRYIINISKVTLSKISEQLEDISGSDYEDIMAQVQHGVFKETEKNRQKLIATRITNWSYKNKKNSHLSKDLNKYENIKVSYDKYWIDLKIYNAITNILSKFGLSIITILNNNMIFDILSSENNDAFYDINGKHTYIYCGTNKFKLETGYDDIVKALASKLKLESDEQLSHVINTYSLIHKEYKECTIINHYTGSYLEATVVNGNNFKNCMNNVLSNFIGLIKNKLKENININKNVIININDKGYKLFKVHMLEYYLYNFLPRSEMPFLGAQNYHLISQVYTLVENENYLVSSEKSIVVGNTHKIKSSTPTPERTVIVNVLGGKQ